MDVVLWPELVVTVPTGLGGNGGVFADADDVKELEAGAVSLRTEGPRESLLDADREGPSNEATTSERSTDLEEPRTEGPDGGAGTLARDMYDLNSYLSVRSENKTYQH